jgi:transcriptional regulator with XRE-family HTH domain
MRRTISKHEEIRRLRGFTVSALAEEIGFSHSYVSLVEGGLEKPSARYRKAAARVLGVPEDLIFEPVTTATAPLRRPREVNSAHKRGA